MSEMIPLLDVHGAARALGLRPATIYSARWRAHRGLRAIRLPGGALRFSQYDLNEWIRRHREPGNGPRRRA